MPVIRPEPIGESATWSRSEATKKCERRGLSKVFIEDYLLNYYAIVFSKRKENKN